MKKNVSKLVGVLCCILLTTISNAFSQQVTAGSNQNKSQDEKTIPVTWENFVRAETDRIFKTYSGMGAFGKFFHVRAITPIDKQNVSRMNRDTRYSVGIFDLTNSLTVSLPNTNGRYISMQVINEDEYTKSVEYKEGDYTFTKEKIGTRYVCLIVRILINGEDEKDNQIVTDLQNKITVKQNAPGSFEIPNWDSKSLDTLRNAIKVLASTLTDTKQCFGDVNEVNPIAHMLGAVSGWGGIPVKDAIYINAVPEMNDGKTAYKLNVKDVPVDGFWSISVYNKDGFFERNQYNLYSINNTTAVKEKDGSIIIHFGGDPKQPNFIPVTEGWNYTVRLYKARNELINGTWNFPGAIKN